MISGTINYSLRDFEGISILDLTGSLTILTSDYFKSVIHNMTERESIIVNMENISFITSSGLNALVDVSYYAREKGNRVIVMSAANELKELVDYADYFSHLIFAENPQEGKIKIDYYT